ncbi:MAG: energy transducer TonB [Gammaproteobacteria bacterium]
MNAVVRPEVFNPALEGVPAIRRPGFVPVAQAASGERLLPASTWFGEDRLKTPFWRSTGVAIFLELLLLAGLFAWIMIGRLAPANTDHAVTAVTLVAPPKPPRPVVRPPEPPMPMSQVAPAPALPRIAPLPPIADGLPVPRALLLPPPPAASAPPRTTGRVNPLAFYSAILREQVRAALVVPAIARQMGLSGKTLVIFRLEPDGQMLWARVARTSGSSILDRAALEALHQADFPPFVPRMKRVDTTFELWVHLNVDQS